MTGWTISVNRRFFRPFYFRASSTVGSFRFKLRLTSVCFLRDSPFAWPLSWLCGPLVPVTSAYQLEAYLRQWLLQTPCASSTFAKRSRQLVAWLISVNTAKGNKLFSLFRLKGFPKSEPFHFSYSGGGGGSWVLRGREKRRHTNSGQIVGNGIPGQVPGKIDWQLFAPGINARRGKFIISYKAFNYSFIPSGCFLCHSEDLRLKVRRRTHSKRNQPEIDVYILSPVANQLYRWRLKRVHATPYTMDWLGQYRFVTFLFLIPLTCWRNKLTGFHSMKQFRVGEVNPA